MKPIVSFTPEVISGIVGVLLTILFSYFPKLRVWYAGLVSETKSLIMLGLLAVSSVTIYLLAFYGVIVTSEPVTWYTLINVLFVAVATNQPAYKLLPQPADVKEAILDRDYIPD